MNLAGIRTHFTNWREWEFNPIVIKELRQAVRSWAVTGMLLLFLTILFITSLCFLVFQSFDVDPDEQLGGTMFSCFVSILAIASIFFIPLYMGIRVAAERRENNPDLLYVSTLSPARIIRGKFLCGAYVVLLFFSACMPFMAFTNLLRGVDLPSIFFILFYLFLGICTANMVAIFLACIPASMPFRILFALAGIFVATPSMIFPALAYSFEFMRSGIGATMGERNFWIAAMTTVLIDLAITGLFFVLSVALVSPQSANRALPVRIYITAIWLLGGLLAIGWVMETGDAININWWAIPTYWLMIFSLLQVISNNDRLSQRVLRAVPQSPLKRIPAFIFFNGAAGGVIWVALIVAATYLTALGIANYFPKSIRFDDSRPWFTTTAAYIFDYALTAVFIQRKFLSSRPAKMTGLLAIVLASIWALAPSVILFFLNQLTWKSIEGLELGNIFNVFSMHDDSRLIYHSVFAFAWLGLILLLNLKWFFDRIRNFRPPPADAPPVIA
jgi:hypothetical protein